MVKVGKRGENLRDLVGKMVDNLLCTSFSVLLYNSLHVSSLISSGLSHLISGKEFVCSPIIYLPFPFSQTPVSSNSLTIPISLNALTFPRLMPDQSGFQTK